MKPPLLTVRPFLQQVNYNSLAWSLAENGDPLLCVAGDGYHQIKVLNIKTNELVAVRLAFHRMRRLADRTRHS